MLRFSARFAGLLLTALCAALTSCGPASEPGNVGATGGAGGAPKSKGLELRLVEGPTQTALEEFRYEVVAHEAGDLALIAWPNEMGLRWTSVQPGQTISLELRQQFWQGSKFLEGPVDALFGEDISLLIRQQREDADDIGLCVLEMQGKSPGVSQRLVDYFVPARIEMRSFRHLDEATNLSPEGKGGSVELVSWIFSGPGEQTPSFGEVPFEDDGEGRRLAVELRWTPRP